MRPNTLRAVRCIVTVIWMSGQLFIAAGQPNMRTMLQSIPVAVTPERLKLLEVPEDAEILFALASDCPPPSQLSAVTLARMGQVCFLIKNIRSCLNISSEAPQFLFRGCTKADGCPPIKRTHEQSACIFKGVGIEVMESSECPECSCGIPPGNDGLFQERGSATGMSVPGVKDSTCFTAQPEQSNLTVQAVCSGGMPISQNRWHFMFPEDANDGVYDCLLSRRCIEGVVDEVTMCYQNRTDAPVVSVQKDRTGTEANARASPVQILLSYSLPFCLVLAAIFWDPLGA